MTGAYGALNGAGTRPPSSSGVSDCGCGQVRFAPFLAWDRRTTLGDRPALGGQQRRLRRPGRV